jgi:hypothetical protein
MLPYLHFPSSVLSMCKSLAAFSTANFFVCFRNFFVPGLAKGEVLALYALLRLLIGLLHGLSAIVVNRIAAARSQFFEMSGRGDVLIWIRGKGGHDLGCSGFGPNYFRVHWVLLPATGRRTDLFPKKLKIVQWSFWMTLCSFLMNVDLLSEAFI